MMTWWQGLRSESLSASNSGRSEDPSTLVKLIIATPEISSKCPPRETRGLEGPDPSARIILGGINLGSRHHKGPENLGQLIHVTLHSRRCLEGQATALARLSAEEQSTSPIPLGSTWAEAASH
ncbi:hypothetical protein Nepgr_027216 [Nepenthes gracilis]|uniref:Uncharacterized protein n=1 Tax=Nepenthes gracilis TaxID=150966 RepID=A0AAD3T9Z4_NEPGR|nr:hypothetical protein Nepgr_027216 [Nepenthes gracilis]